MYLYCPHEGLCLYLSLQESGLTENEFCRMVGITGPDLKRLTLSKRIDSTIRERAAIALALPEDRIFNDRVKRVWSFHHPFTRQELTGFVTTN